MISVKLSKSLLTATQTTNPWIPVISMKHDVVDLLQGGSYNDLRVIIDLVPGIIAYFKNLIDEINITCNSESEEFCRQELSPDDPILKS
jgi:hypothetical protein